LESFVKVLKDGDRVNKITLFGSTARERAEEESDIENGEQLVNWYRKIYPTVSGSVGL